MLLRLPLAESSAKVRTRLAARRGGGLRPAIWAGVIPLHTVVEPAVVDPALRVDAAMPDYVAHYRPAPTRPPAAGRLAPNEREAG